MIIINVSLTRLWRDGQDPWSPSHMVGRRPRQRHQTAGNNILLEASDIAVDGRR